ncbi:phage tail assembly chaperone [Parerythrobacter lacustris]|uniref:Phage tail assembly chaperone n=1 Tax=Parerythrobacter lacustris TaxID=2969984 RepID=A0ABT1XSS2_9SPHN|nr:phage tail assembly chaperone [Parerythrobacter lacustris]MCR2834262.1 phage tail assembly chaperone [Parerythrobacter lacustris]
MSDMFGAAATRLSGIAARALGWRPAEFWAATPAELVAALSEPGSVSAPVDRAILDRLMEQDRHGR